MLQIEAVTKFSILCLLFYKPSKVWIIVQMCRSKFWLKCMHPSLALRLFDVIHIIINCSVRFKVLWRYAIHRLVVFSKQTHCFLFDPFYILSHISYRSVIKQLHNTRAFQLYTGILSRGFSSNAKYSWLRNFRTSLRFVIVSKLVINALWFIWWRKPYILHMCFQYVQLLSLNIINRWKKNLVDVLRLHYWKPLQFVDSS